MSCQGITEDEVLRAFQEIVDQAIEVRKSNQLGPGLGTKYPRMENAKLHSVITPPLYFRTLSGKKIPQIVGMELPLQAFGLQGILSETFFDDLSDLYGYRKGFPRENFPTRMEYLDYKREELCLRLEDILEGFKGGSVIFEVLMIDVANKDSLSELLEKARNAEWQDSVSRELFRECMLTFHKALERAFEERGQLPYFYYDRAPQYSRRAQYINRLRQLLKQIQEN